MQVVHRMSSPFISAPLHAMQYLGYINPIKSSMISEIDGFNESVYLRVPLKLANNANSPYVMSLVNDFDTYRSRMNEKIMASENLILKRIFNLDTNAYAEGSLDVRTKELIGLTCSLVLRCDDCVKYHLGKCKEQGLTAKEVHEAMGVATLVGGTIVIPHLRRAFEYWEALENV